jgi:quercetin dioxygenase-like cupin family protein
VIKQKIGFGAPSAHLLFFGLIETNTIRFKVSKTERSICPDPLTARRINNFPRRRTVSDPTPRAQPTSLPADDLSRSLTVARPDTDQGLEHLAVVGDTYTILVDGSQTGGRYTLIDMLIPPGGGPPPHRHDFEEMFSILEGEVTLTFRGETIVAGAGTTVNIPANAPHQFQNTSDRTVRLLCQCCPSGQEEFFREVGVPVATRTTPAPKMSDAEQQAFGEKSMALAAKYRTELLRHA